MARMSRQESKDLTRQRLREAALAEFERHGVAGASIDRITDTAGYSRGAFYANYDSKFELALEMWSENAEQQTAKLDTMIASMPSPQVMLGLIRDHFDRLTQEPVWWLVSIEVRMEATRNPEFRERYQASDDMVAGQLRHMLTNLCRLAGCEETADIDFIATVVSGFTQGLNIYSDSVYTTSPGIMLVRLLVDLLGRPPSLIAAAP
jgi:AcrR family transcriptional regulator